MTFSMSPMSPSTKIDMKEEEAEEKVPLKSLKDLEEEKAAEKKKQQRFVINHNLSFVELQS